MSLSNACSYYGVSEEDCMAANIECKYRAAYGNSYAVVKICDILAIKAKLNKEADDKKEKDLIAELGEEGYAKMIQEDKQKKLDEAKKQKDEKEAEEAKQKADAYSAKTKADIFGKMKTIVSISSGGISSTKGMQLAKTAAKKEWFLADADIESLPTETIGRAKKYAIRDLIAKADEKHGFRTLKNKIEAAEDKARLQKLLPSTRIPYYADYLKEKLEEEISKLPEDLASEARAHAKKILQDEIDESAAKVKAAQEIAAVNVAKMRSFDAVFGSSSVDKENNNVGVSKKAKTM
jgi:hypothetical protein